MPEIERDIRIFKRLNRFRHRSAIAVAVTFLIAPLHAATLDGFATFQNTNDLTIVDLGIGPQLEFLDLSVTQGLVPSDAVAAYMADGFAWATLSQMESLLMAFDLSLPRGPAGWRRGACPRPKLPVAPDHEPQAAIPSARRGLDVR